MLDKSPPSSSQWRACPMVFCGNKSGAGNRLRLRPVVFPGNLACAPPGYPALGHLNGLHSLPGCLPCFFPGRPLFAFPVCCSFLPPPVRLSLSPCSSIESGAKAPSCLSSTQPSKISLIFPPTTIAATPFPRHIDCPSLGSPSQVDLDRPPLFFASSKIPTFIHQPIEQYAALIHTK